ncbi:MAG: RNA-binding domain-containing protein [Candidatus Omnitrophota bacterium]
MGRERLINLLDEIISLPKESEWVEFKHARQDFSFDKIGKYFSAISNEANLNDKDCGWLIFGIDDKTKNIKGSNYRIHGEYALDSLKKEVADKTTNRISFMEIYEIEKDGKRIIMFQIPPAPQGMPVAWEGHYYGREGESLAALSTQEYEAIRNQTKPDWSAQICASASVSDLDVNAILKAKQEFKIKFPKISTDVDIWDDITFLNKAKIAIEGKLTRTAILLLGKPESDCFISPFTAKISWILRDEKNADKDYEHFGAPFIINTDLALAKIRNLKYRYLPDNTLFPIEITQYEPYVIREALHNCIAHQDYELCSRISVVEKPEELVFSNAGSFLPGSVESVIEKDAPPKYYRNQFLANAMVTLNMIDTVGGGIKKMFVKQRERFFPLPTYILENPNEVTVKITGKVIDPNYTQLLIKHTDLGIQTVILLDKVQKKNKIDKQSYQRLKKQGLVEGRYPNLFVVSRIAAVAGEKAVYIKNRAFDKEHYKKMIISFLEKYGSAARKEINDLLMDKLSNVLSPEQKIKKISNLLFDMANNDKSIINSGPRKIPKWALRRNK